MKQAEIFRRSSDNHKQPQKLVLNLEEARGPAVCQEPELPDVRIVLVTLAGLRQTVTAGSRAHSQPKKRLCVWKQDKGQSWNNGNKPTPGEKMSRTKMHLKIVRSVRR